MSQTIFYIALFVHIVSLIVGFGSVIVVDFFGLLWIFKKKTLKEVTEVAHVTQFLIWLGWGGLVISGPIMLYIKGYIITLCG